MSNYVYGIDFTDENCTLAVLDIDKKKIIKIFSEKSCLYFISEYEIYTGKIAEHKYSQNHHSGLFINSPKVLLYNGNYKIIKNLHIRPEQLLSSVIKSLKKQADAFLNSQVNEVTIGRPLKLSTSPETDKEAENILIRAGFESGFNLVHIQYEVVALGYAIELQLSGPSILFVADAENFKMDIVVLRLNQGLSNETNRLSNILFKSGLISNPVCDDGSLNISQVELSLKNDESEFPSITKSVQKNKLPGEKVNFLNNLMHLTNNEIDCFTDLRIKELGLTKIIPDQYYYLGLPLVKSILDNKISNGRLTLGNQDDRARGLAYSYYFY